ncbi:hypothetical protein PoB_002835500 [Plakobranchus ocellatus]|uniref:Uncharacterized protein n=1 Tax=Plakobranchus ocellatus TaxID=259542 RepID=A0AAV4A3C1_9GAST|nr:hypothetical protein PoB_002835500 [Plakobranchus ocellatus]
MVQVSLAFVCPPNICDNYTTQKPLNCKGNVIKGGFCDCEQFCAKKACAQLSSYASLDLLDCKLRFFMRNAIQRISLAFQTWLSVTKACGASLSFLKARPLATCVIPKIVQSMWSLE